MNKTNTLVALFGSVFWLLCLGGWVANIVKLITTNAPIAEWTIIEIARIVGIFFAPLGVVLGYF